MINLTKVLTVLVGICIIFVVSNIALGLIPWYMQENPMKIIDKQRQYLPGDPVRVTFKRRALIGFQGKVTRELVRINPDSGATEEIWKSSLDTSIGRGEKTIILTYNVPTLAMYPTMIGNTYKFQGSMCYKPFGLVKKTFFFYTEPFQIRLKSE